jgi:hypothetical protein
MRYGRRRGRERPGQATVACRSTRGLGCKQRSRISKPCDGFDIAGEMFQGELSGEVLSHRASHPGATISR